MAVLLHGGYWSLPWSADLMAGPARELARRGLASWNVEYRRLGEPGGGWPGTFDDVLAGFDALAALPEAGLLDLSNVVLAGHSAGGHLALWLAAERGASASRTEMAESGPGAAGTQGSLPQAGTAPGPPRPVGALHLHAGEASAPPSTLTGMLGGPRIPRIAGVAALAAVTDLRRAWEIGAGGSAVEALLGGPPGRYPERYAAASPAERLPLGMSQLLLTGDRDRMVPAELSDRYATAARRAGDPVDLVVLARTGHMDVVDPGKKAWKAAAEWIENTAGAV